MRFPAAPKGSGSEPVPFCLEGLFSFRDRPQSETTRNEPQSAFGGLPERRRGALVNSLYSVAHRPLKSCQLSASSRQPEGEEGAADGAEGGKDESRRGGNRENAAKQLGIGARTLYRKLKEYDIG
jgi:hypothetical protein